MKLRRLRSSGSDQRRGRAAVPLTATQSQWLGATILAAQVPGALHVPIWIALLGCALVALRLGLAARDRGRPGLAAARIPSWALVLFAIAIAALLRASYGYLLGRDPSVAFLFVLVGIKFLESRTTRDGTLLVCLAAFLAITPFLFGQSPASAIAMLPALLLLGATLAALAARTPRAVAAAAPRRAVVQTGAMLLQGLPIALLLFVLFPRIAGPLWGMPQSSRATTGLSDTMSPGMIAELTQEDTVALRADFAGAPPPPSQLYWRGPVMSRFDGRTWSASFVRPDGHLAEPGDEGIDYTVTLEPNDRPWLFALELPAAMPKFSAEEASIDVVISRDRQLVARRSVGQAMRYRQRSLLSDRHPALARDSAENLRLPPDANPRTLALATQLRRRHAADREYVDAVLAHFRDGPFVYTLAPGVIHARDPVDGFLFETQRGFCEHYASAFAVLLRAAGIPARVVTGYQGGEFNRRGNYLIVRQSDAHAWVEAIVDGQWRRFDPTGAVSPLRIESGISRALSGALELPLFARLDAGFLKDAQLLFDAINHSWRRNIVGFDASRQREVWRSLHLDPALPGQAVGVIAIAGAAWMGVVLGWLAWRRGRRERVAAMWLEVCARLARAGLPREGHEGPLDYTARASRRWPDYAIAFHAIGEAYARLRYASVPSRERDALLAMLKRAVEVLPAPAVLRGGG
jgi:transglutaminase-like putative cysteine protease